MRWSKAFLRKFSLIVVALLLLTTCEKYEVAEDVEGPVSDAGKLYTQRRYYVDREGIENVENQVNPYISGGEPGSKIYWSLIDPDDPADDEIIDRNGSDGDDNEGKKSDFYGSSVSHEGNAAYSIIDEDGYTECYFDIEPVEVYLEDYIAGDNFQVKATKDSPDGNTYSQSVTFSVWKKIRNIEYDWMVTPPEATEYEDTDIFYKYSGLFGELQYLFSNIDMPDRLTYVEIADDALIRLDDSKDPRFTEPREWSPLPHREIVKEIDFIWKYNDDYVYIFPMSSCVDFPDLAGISRATTADGTKGFSVVFWWTIKMVAEEQFLDEYDCVKKVLIHELGHQLVNLQDYEDLPGNHTGPDCIMNEVFENEPYFCPRCVVKFRQYYKAF